MYTSLREGTRPLRRGSSQRTAAPSLEPAPGGNGPSRAEAPERHLLCRLGENLNAEVILGGALVVRRAHRGALHLQSARPPGPGHCALGLLPEGRCRATRKGATCSLLFRQKSPNRAALGGAETQGAEVPNAPLPLADAAALPGALSLGERREGEREGQWKGRVTP